MRRHRTSGRAFIYSCAAMLAITIIAFYWAYSSWVTHYQ